MMFARPGNAAMVALLGASMATASPGDDPSVDIRLDTDEAEAVLAILVAQDAGKPLASAHWERVIGSEGYSRLKDREAAMRRPFTDDDFMAFVQADSMAGRAPSLQSTLDAWRAVDVEAAARQALVYLPPDARISATVYPVIKPRSNSFVFEISTNPAIFLYLDPSVSPEKFGNTLVHELHHIGFGSTCPTDEVELALAGEPPNAQEAFRWLGAFGEGFAMLTAAGHPDVHPHEVSDPAERARWDRDMANADTDLKRVETFLTSVLEGELTAEEIRQTAYSFYGIQGPWYTVGWLMAVAIEETFGRDVLVQSFCDPRRLLGTYNAAALHYNESGGDPTAPLWSQSLVDQLGGDPPITAVGKGR